MTDESKVGLVIRRAKALLQRVSDRVDEHEERVRKHKAGGPWHGQAPTLADFTRDRIALRDAIEQYEETGGHIHIPFVSERISGPGKGSTDTVERHESYGQLLISRTSGGHGQRHLYGSRVEYHPVTMRMEVRRSERHFSNDLSYDRFHPRESLLELEMSAAQFTDALTLMNHGEGVPVTIRYVGGVAMEPVPTEHRSEQHMIVEGFKEKMDDVRASVGDDLEKLEAILAKKSIGKADRKEIAWLFEKITRSFSDNAAFTLSQFNEATDKLETEAKKEVEAFAASVLLRAGAEAVQAGNVDLKSGLEGTSERVVLPPANPPDSFTPAEAREAVKGLKQDQESE